MTRAVTEYNVGNVWWQGTLYSRLWKPMQVQALPALTFYCRGGGKETQLTTRCLSTDERSEDHPGANPAYVGSLNLQVRILPPAPI
jgi:hypothetical protein